MIEAILRQVHKYPLDFIAHFFLILPVLIALYRRGYLTKSLLSVGLFFALRFIEEIVMLYYSLNKWSNINLLEGFYVIDTLVVTEIYYVALEHRTTARQIGLILSLITVFTTIVTYVYSEYSFISASLFRLLTIFFSLAYFNKILSENRVKSVLQHAMFWISCGFLIYGMGTFMTSLFIDHLLDPQLTSDETFDLFWSMSQLFSIIQCVLTMIGFWFSRYDRTNYVQPI